MRLLSTIVILGVSAHASVGEFQGTEVTVPKADESKSTEVTVPKADEAKSTEVTVPNDTEPYTSDAFEDFLVNVPEGSAVSTVLRGALETDGQIVGLGAAKPAAFLALIQTQPDLFSAKLVYATKRLLNGYTEPILLDAMLYAQALSKQRERGVALDETLTHYDKTGSIWVKVYPLELFLTAEESTNHSPSEKLLGSFEKDGVIVKLGSADAAKFVALIKEKPELFEDSVVYVVNDLEKRGALLEPTETDRLVTAITRARNNMDHFSDIIDETFDLIDVEDEEEKGTDEPVEEAMEEVRDTIEALASDEIRDMDASAPLSVIV